MSQMGLDNNEQPLPQGYGLSFDYIRTLDDEETVHVAVVDTESSWYPPFKLILRNEVSQEIDDWVEDTKTGFGTLVSHISRVKGTESGSGGIISGFGGTYFVDSEDKVRVAVFKPSNEEFGAPYNPRSYTSTSRGTQDHPDSGSLTVQAGKGAAREIAAYLLDHPTNNQRREGFCRVPITVPVSCIHGAFNNSNTLLINQHVQYKFGSLQMYMTNNGPCGELEDDERLEEDDVQKLYLLDMRFANTDRHLDNLLKKAKEGDRYELIPIDHGCCFPDNFKSCCFEWLTWKKTKNNFSDEIVEYIKSLNSEEDIELLIKEKFTMSYIFARNLAITTMLLQEAVLIQGLSPFEIGHFMCKGLPNVRDEDYSRVERAVSRIVGAGQSGQISALQKTVLDSIKDLVGVKLGEQYRSDEVVLELVEKDSRLQDMDMTKQQVEDELLQIVSTKLKSNIKQYATELRA